MLALVWLELFALLALGIACGFAIGYAASLMVSTMIAAWSGFALPVEFMRQDWGLVGLLLGFAAALGICPALFAYRQSPAAALRG